MSKRHEGNKQFNVWLPEEEFEKVKAFLDKFSAGDSFSEQARNFFHWLVTQTEGIDQTRLAMRLQQIENQKKAREFHCLRGIMQDFQLRDPEQRRAFCLACRQRYPKEFEQVYG